MGTAALAATIASSATAGGHPADTPAGDASLRGILACREVSEPQARLACFDASAKTLAAAAATRAIVVLDRDEVRKTRRSVFGFNIPDIGIFGAKTPAEDAESRQIDAVARTVRQDRDGRWLITLDDGAVWRQTDDNMVALPPRSGSKITIRRAALGSFFLRIDGQPGIKAQRVS